jgi:hypothetical protein
MDVWVRHSGQDVFLYIYVPNEHHAHKHHFTYGAQGLQERAAYVLLSNLPSNLGHSEVEQAFES